MRHFEQVLEAYSPPSRAARETQERRRAGRNGAGPALPGREDSMRILAAMFSHMLGDQDSPLVREEAQDSNEEEERQR